MRLPIIPDTGATINVKPQKAIQGNLDSNKIAGNSDMTPRKNETFEIKSRQLNCSLRNEITKATIPNKGATPATSTTEAIESGFGHCHKKKLKQKHKTPRIIKIPEAMAKLFVFLFLMALSKWSLTSCGLYREFGDGISVFLRELFRIFLVFVSRF